MMASGVMALMTPLAILLLLPTADRERPLGSEAAWGVWAGVFLIFIAVAVGAHQADQTFFSPFWMFVGTAVPPMGLGALLVLASLPIAVGTQARQVIAVVVAVVVTAAGMGYAIDFAGRIPDDEAWFFLGNVTGRVSFSLLVLAVVGLLRPGVALAGAAAVAVATVAHAAWLITLDGAGFDALDFVYATSGGIAGAVVIVVCATATRGKKDAEGGQFWEPASSSSAVP